MLEALPGCQAVNAMSVLSFDPQIISLTSPALGLALLLSSNGNIDLLSLHSLSDHRVWWCKVSSKSLTVHKADMRMQESKPLAV